MARVGRSEIAWKRERESEREQDEGGGERGRGAFERADSLIERLKLFCQISSRGRKKERTGSSLFWSFFVSALHHFLETKKESLEEDFKRYRRKFQVSRTRKLLLSLQNKIKFLLTLKVLSPCV